MAGSKDGIRELCAKDCRWFPAGKGKEMDSSLEFPERNATLSNTLILAQ